LRPVGDRVIILDGLVTSALLNLFLMPALRGRFGAQRHSAATPGGKVPLASPPLIQGFGFIDRSALLD
jgi:hypothetical protein